MGMVKIVHNTLFLPAQEENYILLESGGFFSWTLLCGFRNKGNYVSKRKTGANPTFPIFLAKLLVSQNHIITSHCISGCVFVAQSCRKKSRSWSQLTWESEALFPSFLFVFISSSWNAWKWMGLLNKAIVGNGYDSTQYELYHDSWWFKSFQDATSATSFNKHFTRFGNPTLEHEIKSNANLE